MQKTIGFLIAEIVMIFVMCGCAQGKSPGERAIVKMIYLDEENGAVRADLTVFEGNPSADTSELQGKTMLLTSKGTSIENAIFNIQQKQNKELFFAQNELLILGPGTGAHLEQYLSFFTQEVASAPNPFVFSTPVTHRELMRCKDEMEKIVTEGVRIGRSGKNGNGSSKRVFEIGTDGEGKAIGYLPVYEFSNDENEFSGVRSLALISGGRFIGTIHRDMMQIMLIISGDTKQADITYLDDKELIRCRLKEICAIQKISVSDQGPKLEIHVLGRVEDIHKDGLNITGEEKRQQICKINRYIEQQSSLLNKITFSRGHDILHFEDSMRICLPKQCNDLRQNGQFYRAAAVQIVSELVAG